MDDKPKFGVDAQKDETSESPLKPQSAAQNQPTFGASAAAQQASTTEQSKPAFGVGAAPTTHQTDTPSFGAQAEAPAASAHGTSIGGWIKNIFGMQKASFWIKQYAYGLVAFAIGLGMGLPMWFGILNLVLYPFTVTILQEIGSNKGQKSTLGSFFFGFSVGMIGDSIWWIVIYGVIRFAIFYFKFIFSCLIGVIGLIYMVSQAKKMMN